MKLIEVYSAQEAKAAAGTLIPFRAPHYTTGTHQLLNEIRLATGGVLYMDELEHWPMESFRIVAEAIRRGPLPLAIILDLKSIDGATPAEASGANEGRRMIERAAEERRAQDNW